MDDFVAGLAEPLPWDDSEEEPPGLENPPVLNQPFSGGFQFDDIMQGLPHIPNMQSSLIDDSPLAENALLSPTDNKVTSQKSLESQPQEKTERYKKVCLPQGQIKDKEPALKKSPSENQQESQSKERDDLQLIT